MSPSPRGPIVSQVGGGPPVWAAASSSPAVPTWTRRWIRRFPGLAAGGSDAVAKQPVAGAAGLAAATFHAAGPVNRARVNPASAGTVGAGRLSTPVPFRSSGTLSPIFVSKRFAPLRCRRFRQPPPAYRRYPDLWVLDGLAQSFGAPNIRLIKSFTGTPFPCRNLKIGAGGSFRVFQELTAHGQMLIRIRISVASRSV